LSGKGDKPYEKTNVIRLLESEGVEFDVLEYETSEDHSALPAATSLGLEVDRVFKTIVLIGERLGYFVCIIPGSCEIDLKKAALAAGDKASALLPLKDLEPCTGYVRGGCSPIGMKKCFPTLLDETAYLFDRISVSAGKRGLQIFLRPADLKYLCQARVADLIK
jgi:Cys-tRNA(Pro)/Cys-tRNA(Cys) deacylase